MEWKLAISALLALSVPAVLIGGLYNRKAQGKGIGWQFIRYTVLATSLPVICLLAINNALSGEAATLIGAAMGFAFGKKDEGRDQ